MRLVKTFSISIFSDKEVLNELANFHNIFQYKPVEKDYQLGDVTELHFIELNMPGKEASIRVNLKENVKLP